MPDRASDPRLFDLVNQCNMHPTNHLDVSYSRCNRKSVCIYGFPQPCNPTTRVDEFGRVHLRRRSPEDAWVVSYCPALTRLMESHCHVDICFTSDAFLYLYKYLYKGVDNAKFTISNDNPTDEFHDYLHARYLSSGEAVWRILAFDITAKFPAVTSYSLHLPGRQFGQMLRDRGEASTISPLLVYLARPVGGEWDNLKYLDFYQQYTVYPISPTSPRRRYAAIVTPLSGTPTPNTRRYGLIRRGRTRVCRLHFVPIRSGDLYYLRSLLLHRSSHTFEGFRVVEGIVHPTFQSAAIAMGLFRDRNEVQQALQEGVAALLRPSQLRFLFANMIADIAEGPLRIWEEFREHLSKDFLYSSSESVAADLALHSIADILRGRGLSLADVGLPCPFSVSSEVLNELNYFASRLQQLRMAHVQRQLTFNPEQEQVFRRPIEVCAQPGPQSPIFLDGKAGRGKSYVVECLTWWLRSRREIVLVTGSTALSVIGYDRGRTAHSTFGIPVNDTNSEFSCRIRPHSAQAHLICAAKLII